MSQEVITKFEAKYRKPQTAAVRSGDTVRVHQKVKEGGKERVQIFEGAVIRTRRLGSLNAAVTVRRIASGVGVEKTYLLHSPRIVKVDVVKRSKVRRNLLSYLRERQGRAARLADVGFDREAVNVTEPEVKPEATKKESDKEESKAEESKTEVKETAADKAAAKKAKAEEFRKAQEAKK